MNQLNLKEQELSDSVEAGEWQSVMNLAEEIKQAQQVAKATFLPVTNIPIQLSQQDFRAVQIKALYEGMAYQTFISTIIHKYLTGRLVESVR
jgi:predicted DNA binding CopG/RHH family protein